MLKYYFIFIAILLMGEVHQLSARHIFNAFELDTDISITITETQSAEVVLGQEVPEQLRSYRHVLDAKLNCPCITHGRCSKKTTCENPSG